jgi:hypothetical protein
VEAIFSLSGLLVMPFWALMIFLPHWRWTRRILRSPLVILPPALLYAALALPRLAEVFPAVSSPTLAGITTLLGMPAGATIAWAHFLAFDLFVGRWIYLDSRARHQRPPHGACAVPDPDVGAARVPAVPGSARHDSPILRR